MKRVYCLTVFILLLCLPAFLSAQLPKGVNVANGDGTGNGAADLEFKPPSTTEIEGCNLTNQFRLAVFNLDHLNGLDYSIYVGSDDIAPNLNLPEEYRPMYLRCEINGFVDVLEVESFSFMPLYFGGYAFVFDHYMTIDFSEDCDGENYNLQYYDASMNLQGENGSVYPICSYTAPNDLFDCDYLPTDCPLVKCEDEDWANWNGSYGFLCGKGCSISDPNTPQDHDHQGEGIRSEDLDSEVRNGSVQEIESLISPIIYPNPFQTELNIQWKSKSEISIIRLYNTNGQLINSWNDTGHRAEEILKINTNELSNGVYILQIQSDGETKHHKLLKA